MLVININSKAGIRPEQEDFIEMVISSYDDTHDMMDSESFYALSKRIPILLVNEDTMKKYDSSPSWLYGDDSNDAELEHVNRDVERTYDVKPETEWLGFYGRSSADVFEDTPRIVLCLDRIAGCVNHAKDFIFLLATVVTHELAHAKMDCDNQNSKYRSKDAFWHWMEESMANYYTLECFKEYMMSSHRFNHHWADKCFDFVKDFIKKQPPAYALGYEIFDKCLSSDEAWKRCKTTLGGNKRASEKAAWLKYMQADYKNVDKNKATALYEDVFK